MLAPWLEQLQQQFNHTFQQGRLHHAIMLHGLRGTGKSLLASSLSDGLLCDKPNSLVACGTCKSCLLIKAGNHPDRLDIGEANSSIGVDQIRELGEFIYHSAQQGGNKVVVIRFADSMTSSAANALLKTLEEPNANRYLILCCDDVSRLPATIASRCFKQLVVAEQSANWLCNQLNSHEIEPWQTLFLQQPFLVLDWQEEEIESNIKTLYDCANSDVTAWQLNELNSMLAKRTELVDTFCLFLTQRIKQVALAGAPFERISEQLNSVTLFVKKTKTLAGTNMLLSLAMLQQSLRQLS